MGCTDKVQCNVVFQVMRFEEVLTEMFDPANQVLLLQCHRASSVPLGFDQREALDTIGVGQLVISSPGQTNPPPSINIC